MISILQFPLFHKFWLEKAGGFLIHQDAIAPADAILVLGGGKRERIEQGLKLFREKYAGLIMFTGMYGKTLCSYRCNWALEAQKYARRHGLPENRTIAILGPKNTHDDAVLSKEACLKNKIKSLIVVSEPYHTKRSFYIFRKTYKNSGIKVMVYPVQESWYRKNSWWKSREGIIKTVSEYAKFVYFLLKGQLI